MKQQTKLNQTGKIPADWEVLAIDDVADVVGGGTPSTKDTNNFGGDIPWITPKDLSNYSFRYIQKGERNITKKGLENSSAKLLPKGAVLLTTRAPVGYVAIAANEVTTNQGFRSLIPKNNFSSEFIYYLLKLNTEYLKSHASGTTFGELSGSTLKSLNFPFPPFKEQRAIASILGSLDDKIALNRSMNSTLEAIGQALFARWFVDSEFPNEEGKPYRSSGGEMVERELGEVPKGWNVATIGDLDSSIKYGYTQSASSELIGPKFLRITDIQWGKIEWSTVPYCRISENDIEKYMLLSGDIVVARTGASTGENVYIEDCPKAVFASYLVRIRFKNKNLARYVAKFMRSQVYRDYIDGCIGGSAQPNASAKILTAVNLVVPPDTELIKFGKIVESLELIKFKNNNESTILAQIRDALLPKLMLGEIRIEIPTSKKRVS